MKRLNHRKTGLRVAAIAGMIILAVCLLGLAALDSTKPHSSYLNAGSVLWNF